MKERFVIGLCLAALLPIAGVAGAQGRGPGDERRPRRPPQEALDACADKSSGDSCSFEGPDGTISGTCFAPSEDLPVACRPQNAPR